MDRQKQLAFLVMLYQELASLKVMIAERILLLGHFMKMADTAERQVLILTERFGYARTTRYALCSERSVWRECGIDWAGVSNPGTFAADYLSSDLQWFALGGKDSPKGPRGFKEVRDDYCQRDRGNNHTSKLVSDGLDKDLPGLYQKLENQIRASGLDYHHPGDTALMGFGVYEWKEPGEGPLVSTAADRVAEKDQGVRGGRRRIMPGSGKGDDLPPPMAARKARQESSNRVLA